jgi:hypothetical protein
MSSSSVHTRKPDFCYISLIQANPTYETQSRYHPSSFIPDLDTDRHVQSRLGLLRPIASHLGLLRAISSSSAIFKSIPFYSSYLVLFFSILSYFITLRHSSALFALVGMLRSRDRRRNENGAFIVIQECEHVPPFRDYPISKSSCIPSRLATSDRGDRCPEYFMFSNPRGTPEEPRFLFLAASRPPISCFAICVHFNNVNLSTYTIAPLLPEKDTARHSRHPARRTLSLGLYPPTHMRNSSQTIPNRIPSSFLRFHLPTL